MLGYQLHALELHCLSIWAGPFPGPRYSMMNTHHCRSHKVHRARRVWFRRKHSSHPNMDEHHPHKRIQTSHLCHCTPEPSDHHLIIVSRSEVCRLDALNQGKCYLYYIPTYQPLILKNSFPKYITTAKFSDFQKLFHLIPNEWHSAIFIFTTWTKLELELGRL